MWMTQRWRRSKSSYRGGGGRFFKDPVDEVTTFDDPGERAVDLDVFCEAGGFAEEIEDAGAVGGCVGAGEGVACYPDGLHVWSGGQATYFCGI